LSKKLVVATPEYSQTSASAPLFSVSENLMVMLLEAPIPITPVHISASLLWLKDVIYVCRVQVTPSSVTEATEGASIEFLTP
jgi:hypothetical protein